MELTRWCLRNPIAVTLCYAVIAIAGVTALARMGRSTLPPVALPVIAVTAPYAQAAPNDIERLVIAPIEDQLATLPNVQRITASAQNGIGQIAVQFRYGTGVDADRTSVQQAVDAAIPDMPQDLVRPSVSKDDPAAAPVLEEAVSSAVISRGGLSRLLDREIVPTLHGIAGIGTIRVSGSTAPQLTIAPKAASLDAIRGTPLDVFRAVAAANDLLPGGILRSPLRESTIGIDATATTKAALEQLPVTIPGGPSIRLRDVAEVLDGYADQTVISRVDALPADIVYISNAQGEDTIRTISAARAAFTDLGGRFPLVRFDELRTDAPSTQAAIGGVFQSLSEGIVLTVLVMLAFLHAWRNAVMAAVAIPASLCAAFATMWAFGFTINVLSLMGLSMTIGILVDDSIVIIEAISANAAGGVNPEDAALAGRRELGGAAMAITLVDVAVFAPIALMSGLVGEFMREFALVIVFATAFSLLVSFTLTPLLAARWALRMSRASLDDMTRATVFAALQLRAASFPWTLRTRIALTSIAGWHASINAFNRWESTIANRYALRWLPAAMKRRRIVLIAAGAACIASFIPLAMGSIPTEFSPPINHGEVTVNLTLPGGTPLARTDAATSRFVGALLKDPDVKHVESSAGSAFESGTNVFAGNVAQIGIILADGNATGDAVVSRLKGLGRLVPDASFAAEGKGMGGMPSIAYYLAGDPNGIDIAAQRLAVALRAAPDATDIQTGNSGVQPRLEIHIDRDKARLVNVSVDDAAQTARIESGGSLAMKARLPWGIANAVVRSEAAAAGDMDALQRANVRSSDGRLVPLADVIRIVNEQEPIVIARENRARIVAVTANTRGGAPIGNVTLTIAKRLRDPNFLPPGVRLEPRGDIEQFLDTLRKLATALLFSLFAVYAILAMLYRSYRLPLVIMLTVPLASIGAFGSLWLANVLHAALPGVALFAAQTLNLYSMLGIVLLVGLVAKNGILLVQYAEQAVAQGSNPQFAMMEAARRRFRPIVMTTMAMVAGMLPLALGNAIGAEYRKALGTVVIGGLSSSLLLTLFVLPVVYVGYRTRAAHALRTDRNRPPHAVARCNRERDRLIDSVP